MSEDTSALCCKDQVLLSTNSNFSKLLSSEIITAISNKNVVQIFLCRY